MRVYIRPSNGHVSESRTRSIRNDPELPRPPRARRRLADSEWEKRVGTLSDLSRSAEAPERHVSATYDFLTSVRYPPLFQLAQPLQGLG